MIKNIIFDFGKVLVDFDPYYMTSKYIENEDDINLVSKSSVDVRLFVNTIAKSRTHINKLFSEQTNC